MNDEDDADFGFILSKCYPHTDGKTFSPMKLLRMGVFIGEKITIPYAYLIRKGVKRPFCMD